MQETSVPSFNENVGRNSRIEETDYEIGSNPTTPEKEQPEVQTNLTTVKLNIVAPQKAKKHKKKQPKYEPPVSDRESWWRHTIKVRLSSGLNYYIHTGIIYVYVYVGYT